MARFNLQSVYDRVESKEHLAVVANAMARTTTLYCSRCEWECLTDSKEEVMVKKITIHVTVNKGHHVISTK